MDGIDFARRVLRDIDAGLLALDASILAGTIPDHAAYRYATGRRQGLVAARAMVTELLGDQGREDVKSSL